MIGDLYLEIKEWIQQCFCIHEYKYNQRYDDLSNGVITLECTKCGRLKWLNYSAG